MERNDETLLWELFCATGEPRYYSMYVRAKRRERTDEDEAH